MKVVDLNQEKTTLQEVLKLAGEDNILLKTPDGKEFILAETDDFDREIALVRENGPLMEMLAQRSKGKKIPLSKVKEQLGL